MTLDLRKYIVNKKFVISQYYKRKDNAPIGRILAACAASTHCPVVSTYFYLATEIGFTPEIVASIDKLIKFYRYTEILGQPENSPFDTKGKLP